MSEREPVLVGRTGVVPHGAITAWTHGGFYPGSVSGYESFGDGYLFAFVFNATPDNDTFQNDIYRVLETIGTSQKNWPEHDLFPRYYPED